jgi:hypothetical protein
VSDPTPNQDSTESSVGDSPFKWSPAVEIGVVSTKEATSNAVEDAKAGLASFMIWENMDQAKQALLTKKVEDCLKRMLSNSPTWIPLCLALDGQQCITVKISILLERLDEADMNAELKEIADMSTAIAQLRVIEEALR